MRRHEGRRQRQAGQPQVQIVRHRVARRGQVTWPQAVVQLYVMRLIRGSLRYASRKYWPPLTKDLRVIYTAADEAAAPAALEDFGAAGRTATRRS
ncbi:MAG TPA: transposase [Streptosporangiaceae bacterium]|nr:transposase [Streptosporangiaceae bacterium]